MQTISISKAATRALTALLSILTGRVMAGIKGEGKKGSNAARSFGGRCALFVLAMLTDKRLAKAVAGSTGENTVCLIVHTLCGLGKGVAYRVESGQVLAVWERAGWESAPQANPRPSTMRQVAQAIVGKDGPALLRLATASVKKDKDGHITDRRFTVWGSYLSEAITAFAEKHPAKPKAKPKAKSEPAPVTAPADKGGETPEGAVLDA